MAIYLREFLTGHLTQWLTSCVERPHEVYQILYGELPPGVSSTTDIGDDSASENDDACSDAAGMCRSAPESAIDGESLGLTESCKDDDGSAESDESGSLIYSESSARGSGVTGPSEVRSSRGADGVSVASPMTLTKRQRRRFNDRRKRGKK